MALIQTHNDWLNGTANPEHNVDQSVFAELPARDHFLRAWREVQLAATRLRCCVSPSPQSMRILAYIVRNTGELTELAIALEKEVDAQQDAATARLR